MPHAPDPLGIALLALLAEAPATREELREALTSRRHDRIIAWDDASFTAAVAALEDDALADRRDGSLVLLPAGREALVAWTQRSLATMETVRPQFDLALLTAHAVPVEVARAALTRRLAELDDVTGQLTTRIRTSARRGLSEAYWMQADYRRSLLVAEFTWLSRLLERIETGELTWTVGDVPPSHPESV